MNFNDKKVQYAIVGALVGCILLFVILQFVILPAFASWKEDKAKAVEIQKKVAEMRQVVQSRGTVQGQIDMTKAAIIKMEPNIPLPILGNYLLGMEENLRACITNAAVAVSAIADNDVLEISSENAKFKVYRVRVSAKSGLRDYIRLAEHIYNSNPLLSISAINVVASDESPMLHEMSFVVAWLIWSEPAKRPAFLIKTEKNGK